ncbi:MAG: hypothetical protein ACREM9_01885 [Gemmatimonadales bacterium]
MPVPKMALLGIALLACSPSPAAPGSFQPDILGDEVRVANGTPEPFVFFAFAADMEPLILVAPEADVDQAGVTLVPPGEERPVGELEGREHAPGGGVALYLYRMVGTSRRARLVRMELVSGEAIRANGGRIVVGKL